ncbi:hypothetical protein M8494_35985 [Serratia ureilytica]
MQIRVDRFHPAGRAGGGALAGSGMFAGLLMGRIGRSLRAAPTSILFARSTCGIGFVGLCLNALLPSPSLAAIYLLAVGRLLRCGGVTALLAATPALVAAKTSCRRAPSAC